MPPRPDRLSAAELGAIAQAALGNALELVEEGELLADAGRWARAYALAVLAGEEFGKVMTCLGALGNPEADTDQFWRDFWWRFLNHQPKYENVMGFASQFMTDESVRQQFREQFAEHVRADQDRKLEALYVDYTHVGLLKPSMVATEDAARDALSVFGQIIRAWTQLTSGQMAEMFVELEEQASEFQAAVASGDHAELERVLQEQAEQRESQEGR